MNKVIRNYTLFIVLSYITLHLRAREENYLTKFVIVFTFKWANGSQQDPCPGYVGHIECADAFSAVVSEIYGASDKKNLKLLDLGCGTGLVGKILKEKLGFVNLVGLDVSQDMLEKAKEKGIYKKLICSYVTEERVADIENAEFDGVLASGVITPGQIRAPAFDEIIRWIKPGKSIFSNYTPNWTLNGGQTFVDLNVCNSYNRHF